MKLKFVLFAILIVFISSKLSRENDSSKKNLKLRKESSKDEFNLSGFHISKLKNSKSDNNESVLSPNTKLNIKKIENPETDYEKIGLVFTFESFDSKLASIMFATGNKNEYFLPYRFIKSQPQFKETGFFFKNKSLELILSNDNNESFNLNILFPIKLIGSYIEYSEGVKLASQINVRREKSIKNIRENLLELKKRTNELSLKNSVINDVKGKIHDVNVQNKTLQNKLQQLKNTSESITNEMTKSENLIKQLKSQLLEQEQNLEVLKNQKISNISEMQSTEDLLKDLVNTNTEEAYRNFVQTLRNAVESEAKDMKSIIKALQQEMLDRSSSLVNLENHIEGHEGVKTFEEFILTITPRIESKNNKKK